MSDIPEDLTFEEPELACILENLQKGRKGSGKYHREGRKGFGKGELRDKKGFGKGEFRDKEGGKGNHLENYKQVRLSCKVIASTEAGEINQPMLRTKAVIDHSWPTLAAFSPVLVASSVDNWGILRKTVLRKRKTIHLFSAATKRQPQNPRPFSVAWPVTISVLRPFLPSRKRCLCTTQTLTRRMERSCSTQTLR